jgi:acyl transferase domain-containing protein
VPALVAPVATSRLRARFAARADTPEAGIAIIGVAGRYPQARNLEEFWANLSQGRNSITEIPADRWDHSLYFDEDRNAPGKTYGKWGGFIDGVDRFDARFFNISPREAALMDPQERLFLECVHAALEDAGYTRDNVAEDGDVGVFAGVMYEEYQLYGAQEQAHGRFVAAPGSPASIANRISSFCDFHGPSLALDTMCSSSLTAIHLACESLSRGGCAVAIAGGVNLSVHPNKYLVLAQGKFISAKGRCESFGEGGEGYVPGEGVGAVLLKPLARAKADGDHIYGVIKASAVNHGGKTNGYTVPNPNAQAKVVERALRAGGIDARHVSYIEAHGTGTSLGDPIEIAGLAKAFGHWTQDRGYCAIGSAKSNIGHCESAAGIAGLTKVLLQLKHRQLAPSLHSAVLNPNIDFAATPFVVQQELAAWPRPVIHGRERPRIAGISSFGAGGANAHVVVEEYMSPAMARASAGPAMVLLSARDEERLRARARELLACLATPDVELADLAYTLQVGREAMDERLALLVHSLDELRDRLAAYLAGETAAEGLYLGQARRGAGALAALAGDDDMAGTLATWFARGKYDRLLDLWTKGLHVDWQRLHGDSEHPRRISLPTYPFAGERHWFPMGTTPLPARHCCSGPHGRPSPASDRAMVSPRTASCCAAWKTGMRRISMSASRRRPALSRRRKRTLPRRSSRPRRPCWRSCRR